MAKAARDDFELIGRADARARIDALLADARAGRSGALLITGETGIGKSALLQYALARAVEMRQLTASGFESESELAFAALADFFQPEVDRLVEIPSYQAAALAGALALGPPTTSDRFAVCAATLNLLDAAARETPLIGILDDAQWLDASSAQAILFAARRLGSEGIVLLIALRELAGTPFEASDLDELAMSGLDRQAVNTLLARRGSGAAPAVTDWLADATAGNPLAVIELAALLTPDQLQGTAPIDERFATPTTVERSFSDRITALPEAAQQALLVLAASESPRLEEITVALHALGLDLHDLDPGERANLIDVVGDGVRFRHPLLRSAVYNGSTTAARRTVHRALAGVASGEAKANRRAWHLAAAAVRGHDAAAADALDRVAQETRTRSGHAEASIALERAADLTDDPELRAHRLLGAADDARIAGRAARALHLLKEALAFTAEPNLLAEIAHLQGITEMWCGAPLKAHRLLVEGAASVEATNSEKAAQMLADAAWAACMGGEITKGREAAQRSCDVAEETDDVTRIVAGSTLGVTLLLGGRAQEALPYFRRYEALLDESGPETRAYHLLRPAGQVLTWLELYDRAQEVFDEMIDRARSESALGALPYALAGKAEVDFRLGSWAAAYAGAAEAVRLAEDTDQRTLLAYASISLARVEAGQGREDDCRAHADGAVDATSTGSIIAYRSAVLGLLELGLGRTDDAIGHLRELARNARKRGLEEPNVMQWAPDLIEAYVRAGAVREAEAELAFLDRQAQETGRTWALAAVARCRGLLASDDGFDASLAHALRLHDQIPTPFERARTELCLGERLRRANRRNDARGPLSSALATFDRLGARGWAERAAHELAATGMTATPRDPSASETLTPQELQVALTVARGATNREAGAALFLSPKTIETHLSRIYRKLDVRSRTELAHRLSSGEFALALSP
jgi:DNA-binding CsgD family transcriptional regulator